ncbi:hypothetical protein INT46_009095 [Mucor plumbeus]|uniref:F-box domain-containing protein n=1 Tax=Mucor plumbeus TaxID=97098 RepID=A0A8H7R469_9FUNG|nr:hypothetical protein INT46_009095 [Mucor plumbeus]
MSTFFSTSSNLFDLLPTEIIWKIMQALDPIDLSATRCINKKFRTFSDNAVLWRNIQLKPKRSSSNCDNLPLWNLADLKAVLQLHLSHIQTIKIWGVRDNIVQYILLNCINLQDLTISGWSTLSDHAFRITTEAHCHQITKPATLNLRRLRLIGQQKSNYTSLDATTFGKLINQCPHLEEITVVSCQIYLQAECLLQMVDQQEKEAAISMQQHYHHQPPSSLKSLVIATKRTWSNYHVTRLFQLCPNLRFLGLVPDSIEIVEYKGINQNNEEITAPMPILDNSTSYNSANSSSQPHLITKNVHAIKDHEMLDSANLIVYKLNPDFYK